MADADNDPAAAEKAMCKTKVVGQMENSWAPGLTDASGGVTLDIVMESGPIERLSYGHMDIFIYVLFAFIFTMI